MSDLLRQLQRLDRERDERFDGTLILEEVMLDNLPQILRALAVQAAVDELDGRGGYECFAPNFVADVRERADELMRGQG